MTVEEEIISMVNMAYGVEAPIGPDTTLAEIGMDSLEMMELQIMLEDRWGEAALKDFWPEETSKLSEIAAYIEKKL